MYEDICEQICTHPSLFLLIAVTMAGGSIDKVSTRWFSRVNCSLVWDILGLGCSMCQMSRCCSLKLSMVPFTASRYALGSST